jgi:hypothetical protein
MAAVVVSELQVAASFSCPAARIGSPPTVKQAASRIMPETRVRTILKMLAYVMREIAARAGDQLVSV